MTEECAAPNATTFISNANAEEVVVTELLHTIATVEFFAPTVGGDVDARVSLNVNGEFNASTSYADGFAPTVPCGYRYTAYASGGGDHFRTRT